MDLSKELNKFADGLKQQRDEIKLQLHLAGMDVKSEWEGTEKQWENFRARLADIADDAKETGDEFLETTKVVGEELKSAYQRIIARLRD